LTQAQRGVVLYCIVCSLRGPRVPIGDPHGFHQSSLRIMMSLFVLGSRWTASNIYTSIKEQVGVERKLFTNTRTRHST